MKSCCNSQNQTKIQNNKRNISKSYIVKPCDKNEELIFKYNKYSKVANYTNPNFIYPWINIRCYNYNLVKDRTPLNVLFKIENIK